LDPGLTGQLLIDNSAWSRLGNRSLPQDRAEEVADWARHDKLVVCLPFLLEAGYSARSGADHVARLDELRAMPDVGIDGLTENFALDAQRELARRGHHRMSPADIVIAALAARAGLGVLHYDSDFDVILEHTTLRFESTWLAPRGSMP
jgi:predicted nucleic acid-binding protein